MGRNTLRYGGAAAVSALAIVAAGCGSNGSPSASSATQATTTTTATGTGGNTAARQAFQTCMTQHGVTITPGAGRPGGGNGSGQPPAGGGGGGGGGGLSNMTAAQRQAFTACRSKLPGRPGGGGPGGNQSNPAFAKYNACLKQHGVTLGASNSQKTFAKAQAACAGLAPKGGTNGGGVTLQ
jgi:hypothetical protein